MTPKNDRVFKDSCPNVGEVFYHLQHKESRKLAKAFAACLDEEMLTRDYIEIFSDGYKYFNITKAVAAYSEEKYFNFIIQLADSCPHLEDDTITTLKTYEKLAKNNYPVFQRFMQCWLDAYNANTKQDCLKNPAIMKSPVNNLYRYAFGE